MRRKLERTLKLGIATCMVILSLSGTSAAFETERKVQGASLESEREIAAAARLWQARVDALKPDPSPVPSPAPATGSGGSFVGWDGIAQCESGGNWSINTGNGYYGGLQFLPSTWLEAGGPDWDGWGTLKPFPFSRAQQIAVASGLEPSVHWAGSYDGC